MAWLLDRYSDAYASNRALRQFFKWLSAEEGVPDSVAGLRPPKVTAGLVPVFTGTELARLERACAGRGFAERRDAAIIAVLGRPGSACRSWPASATARRTRCAAASAFGSGRSRWSARAAGPGS